MELGNLIFGNSRGTYPIDRDWAQKLFCQFLEDLGLDGYGYPQEDSPFYGFERTDDPMVTAETDTFLIRPYYWGEEEDLAVKPNFEFKPKGIEIQWYKYPMRDSYCNVPLTEALLKAILVECRKSIKEEEE